MSNKLAVITGSGRGIGAATALLLARKGFDICINYKKDNQSAGDLAELIRNNGQQCLVIKADLSTEQGVYDLFQTLDDNNKRPDILINNLGILQKQMPLKDMSTERFKEILNTNVLSTFLCCREAVNRMAVSKGGVGGIIVNVSSMASKTGSPNEYVDYAASKGAIDSLTIGLAKEVASEGIRVNAVRPGLIYTDIHADGGEARRVERLKTKIPLQRGGEAWEVAEAVYWLCSDKSSFTTGSFIDVAGGL